MIINCSICGNPFERPVQRGRPAVRCPSCRQQGLQAEKTNTDLITPPGVSTPLSQESSSSPKEKEELPFRATTYQVLVGGGIGIVYSGESKKEADSFFDEYEKKSRTGFGQVGFEAVQMWKLNQETKTYESIRLYESDHVSVM